MDDSHPGPLQLWDNPGGAAQDLFGPPGAKAVRTPVTPPAGTDLGHMAEELFACEALRPHRPRGEGGEEPFSLPWFLTIEHYRHARYGRWIPRVLEFAKHPGETVLGLGYGLGTDWAQYARQGASVVVCSSCSAQLALVRRNFQLRGLEGRFLHADATRLPLESASVDVACVSGLLQQAADPAAVVEEIFRVLRPGGKVIAVTPAKYDVDFWADLLFWWRNWVCGRRRPCESGVRFSARRLRRLFHQFEEHRVHKRQLRRAEVPHLWRLVPLFALERVIGRALIVKAFKPVSTALPLQAAA